MHNVNPNSVDLDHVIKEHLKLATSKLIRSMTMVEVNLFISSLTDITMETLQVTVSSYMRKITNGSTNDNT